VGASALRQNTRIQWGIEIGFKVGRIKAAERVSRMRGRGRPEGSSRRSRAPYGPARIWTATTRLQDECASSYTTGPRTGERMGPGARRKPRSVLTAFNSASVPDLLPRGLAVAPIPRRTSRPCPPIILLRGGLVSVRLPRLSAPRLAPGRAALWSGDFPQRPFWATVSCPRAPRPAFER